MLYWGCWKISWLPPTQSKCLSILTAPTPAAPVIIMMPTLAQRMTSVPNSTELSSSSCGTESWPFSDQHPQSRYTLFNNILFYHEHFFLPRGNWSWEYRNRNNFWAWWAERQHHWQPSDCGNRASAMLSQTLSEMFILRWKREKETPQTHPISPWVLLQHTECSEFPYRLTNFPQLFSKAAKSVSLGYVKRPSDLDSHYTRRVCKWFVQPTKSLWMHKQDWTTLWAQA